MQQRPVFHPQIAVQENGQWSQKFALNSTPPPLPQSENFNPGTILRPPHLQDTPAPRFQNELPTPLNRPFFQSGVAHNGASLHLPFIPASGPVHTHGLMPYPSQQTSGYSHPPRIETNQISDQHHPPQLAHFRIHGGNQFNSRPYPPQAFGIPSSESWPQPVQAGDYLRPAQRVPRTSSRWSAAPPPTSGRVPASDSRISIKVKTENGFPNSPHREAPQGRTNHTNGATHNPRSPSPPDVKPPITQYLETEAKSSTGGLKRPASAQGGEGKRQKGGTVRVPAWRSKAEEAVDDSDRFALEDVNKDVFKKAVERETDPHRLAQRQKQIDFGKNTLGYERYLELVPKSKRQKGDPQTPKVHQVCSKRSWDGQIKKWRRLLHRYDPPVDEGAEFAEEDYVPGYRDNAGKTKTEEAGAEEVQDQDSDGEGRERVEASIFKDDEDEFVGL